MYNYILCFFLYKQLHKDLQNLLIDAIPGFEFPRHNLYDYDLSFAKIYENEVVQDDFVIGVVWNDNLDLEEIPKVLVDRSSFNAELTQEEINILALLMK